MASDDRTFADKVSDQVTHFAGSWTFIIIFAFILTCWLLINTLALFDVIAFDKKPFILLNLALSFVAAFQAPFIMMSQNRAEKKQDEAYRNLFAEIKELVEQDIQQEKEIESLEREIREDMRVITAQQAKLLASLQQAISLEQLTRKDLAEILEHYEDDEP